MSIKLGINNFGRIGRMIFRAALDNQKDAQTTKNDNIKPTTLFMFCFKDPAKIAD